MQDSLKEKVRVYEHMLATCCGCGIVATDADGTIIAMNKGAVALLNLENGPAVGRKIWDRIEGGERKWRDATARCAKDGRYAVEMRACRDKTPSLPVDLEMVPQRNGKGGIYGYVAIFTDATRAAQDRADLSSYADGLKALIESRSEELMRKNRELEETTSNMARLHDTVEHNHLQLKTAHAFLDNILNTIPTGVMTVNTDRVITSFNKAAEEITGFTAAEHHRQTVLSPPRPSVRDRMRHFP